MTSPSIAVERPRTGTGRREEIVRVAAAILEREGPDGLTMRAIATELGIKAPSLYKHIADKQELEVALVADGLRQQTAAFEAAVGDGGDPAMAIAEAYHRWALAHPHLYTLMNGRPLPRHRLPEGVQDRSIQLVVRSFGGDRELARAAWAFAHGMVTLELAGRFPPDADLSRTWRLGIASLAHAPHTKEGTRR